MASGAAPPLRYLAVLALAVVSCLQQLVIPAASQQLSKPRTLDASTATPLLAAVKAAGDGEQQHRAEEAGVAARTCTYTVKVKTSCASPRRSSDAVSLAFGDAYRNEVYVAQLAPRPGFERCATDTFRVAGPCGYGVCYLYLRRAGARDGGWTPEWVRVYDPTSSTPSTFYYGDALPAGVWYGFNRCPRGTVTDGDASSSSDDAAAQSM